MPLQFSGSQREMRQSNTAPSPINSQTTGTNVTKIQFVDHRLNQQTPSNFNVGPVHEPKFEMDDINLREEPKEAVEETDYEKKFKELT